MRALVTYFASEECQSDEGFPGCLRARRAQINKLLWRIWASIASQFREPEDAYEGQLSIEKNAIWGCAGPVGRYPVVSAPPLYHTFIKLSSTFYKIKKIEGISAFYSQLYTFFKHLSILNYNIFQKYLNLFLLEKKAQICHQVHNNSFF